MKEDELHLVLIIDRETHKELAEYKIYAFDRYGARQKAIYKFPQDFPELAEKHDRTCARVTLS